MNMLILEWASLTELLPENAESCNVCGVSGVLPIWIDTMLEVYSRDDLRSLPWHHKCRCLESQLAACARTYSGTRTVPEELGRSSPVLRVLYEVVVPPWLLLHWVTFCTVMKFDEADVQLSRFLDKIGGCENDIFDWDDNDNSVLCRNLERDIARPTLYPRSWSGYMVEIPLRTWLQINMTRRRCQRSRYDLRIRLATVLFGYSSTPSAFKNILALNFDDLAFDTMARAVDKNYRKPLGFEDPDSDEFWTSANLENWLLAQSEALCHDVWHSSPRPSLLKRVQAMDIVVNVLPQRRRHGLMEEPTYGNLFTKTRWQGVRLPREPPTLLLKRTD
ncbi:hypothetical protein K438DRAFT_1785437 [Mycena galopus ATCC 62051]|nr:hypothetical protein K438DRAFT_1785437 [Mycena galopus ATCC 62051]